MTVVCRVADCINKGKEVCTEQRVYIDAEGYCASYETVETAMKKNKGVDRERCKK